MFVVDWLFGCLVFCYFNLWQTLVSRLGSFLFFYNLRKKPGIVINLQKGLEVWNSLGKQRNFFESKISRQRCHFPGLQSRCWLQKFWGWDKWSFPKETIWKSKHDNMTNWQAFIILDFIQFPVQDFFPLIKLTIELACNFWSCYHWFIDTMAWKLWGATGTECHWPK